MTRRMIVLSHIVRYISG